MLRALAVSTTCIAASRASPPPVVEHFKGASNVPDPWLEDQLTWPPAPPYGHTVKELGDVASLVDCETACIRYVNSDVSPVSGWTRCQSYTWMSDSGRCVAVLEAGQWQPFAAENAISGRLTWPPAHCASSADCSYNGRCKDALCSCNDAWEGDRCQTLSLLPTRRDWGMRQVDDGENTSSWGGSVLLDPSTGIFHMWASEMLNHCGINSWSTNSRVVHLTSSTAEGPYERKEEVWPAFAHEPNVVRAPSGELVMYFTSSVPGTSPPTACDICTNGFTPTTCPGGAAASGPTYMSYATAPDGPWSKPALLFNGQDWNMDTNLAVVILEDSSVIGIGRTGGGPTGIVAHLVTASDWRDPTSYLGQWDDMLFPNTTILDNAGVEDPHVYFDAQGVFHAVFHNQLENDDERICGAHAFSVDGLNWTFTGTAWNNTVTYLDENNELTSYAFSRRERPHVIFGDPTLPFKITHLSTGVQYGEGSPIYSEGQDACYTVVQPVRGSHVGETLSLGSQELIA